MPTEWEMGFAAGWRAAHYETIDFQRKLKVPKVTSGPWAREDIRDFYAKEGITGAVEGRQWKKTRKLSKWQKFVKANSKKSKYIYKSGAKKGKLNLKKMGVDYRKKRK